MTKLSERDGRETVLTVEELEESVKNIARKYSRKTTMSSEEMEQELWMWMCIKLPENLALANVQLVNRAKTLCYENWKMSCENIVDYDDPVGELYVNENRKVKLSKENFDDVIVKDMIKNLSGRERKYVVAKAYLSEGFECFEEEFGNMVKDLDSEKIEVIRTAKKITDDIILKIFCDVKTGSNSGTARAIKTNLKKAFGLA